MSIKIELKGKSDTKEYKDGTRLKEILEKINFQADGQILIQSNATLFGQKRKDIDLIVLGEFKRTSLNIQTRAHNDTDLKNRKIWINNFCFCIETKHHNHRDIRLEGTTLSVKYDTGWSDVTTQSEEQKYSLVDFFNDRLGYSPYVYNFIWLCNLTQDNINNLTNSPLNNYLPNDFRFEFLLEKACIQRPPFQPNGKDFVYFSSISKDKDSDPILIQKCFDIFEKVKIAVGELTRKKIEYITNQILNTQQYAQAIGNELVVISGRAGTGKTIKILRIACDLALNSGKRCLILTYNHALASDIQRMLALIEIPDTVDGHTVNIMTLHKFFYELILGFGISTEPETEKEKLRDRKYIEDYISNYKKYLELLIEYINNGLIEDKDIQDLMLSRYDTVNWDYILIDESQDWDEKEKEVLYRIFTPKRIIIADGVDQLIRSQNRCNWTRNIKFTKTTEKKGLRQKVNLIEFVNAYAEQFNLNWSLEPANKLVGGKIIITNNSKDYSLFKQEYKRCSENGNQAYEMLFLVPPALVNRDQNNQDDRSFLYKEDFEKNGLPIWDGTSKDLRTIYPVELNQHRILQYESCRGIEGWTVVCLDFDDFIRYKIDTYNNEIDNQPLMLETEEERKNRFVYLWGLIPLTRAIDTLVITIKDENSLVAKNLKKIYQKSKDYVDWKFDNSPVVESVIESDNDDLPF